MIGRPLRSFWDCEVRGSSEPNLVGFAKVKQVLDRAEVRRRLIEILDEMKLRSHLVVTRNATVLIKPNICHVRGYETGATVDPYVAKCLVDWLLKTYQIRRITIGEADATRLNVDVAFRVLGWRRMFESYRKVQLLNLSKDTRITVRQGRREWTMSRTYMNSDFLISLAKLKTHTVTKISCNLKNIYGANPVKYKAQYHDYLDGAICAINHIRVADLCLVDGIIAMEGDGPIGGTAKAMGLLIVGSNPVATDYAVAQVMGFRPERISHLKLAAKEGLGDPRYTTFGEELEDIREKFEFVAPWKQFARSFHGSPFLRRIRSLRSNLPRLMD